MSSDNLKKKWALNRLKGKIERRVGGRHSIFQSLKARDFQAPKAEDFSIWCFERLFRFFKTFGKKKSLDYKLNQTSNLVKKRKFQFIIFIISKFLFYKITLTWLIDISFDIKRFSFALNKIIFYLLDTKQILINNCLKYSLFSVIFQAVKKLNITLLKIGPDKHNQFLLRTLKLCQFLFHSPDSQK